MIRKAYPRTLAAMGVAAGALVLLAASMHRNATAPPEPTVHMQPVPDDSPRQEWFEKFALNVLLVPLLDDSQPPRWSEVGLDMYCGPNTRILVDGAPMQPNQEIPRRAFHLRWDIDACTGLADGNLDLSGSVDLMVFQEEDGMSALVHPEGLASRGLLPVGSRWAPFVAYAKLGI